MAIAEGLRLSVSLTSLGLGLTDLKDEGVASICDALQNNDKTKLASLEIEANNIGTSGAKSVAAMLAVTPSLTWLNIGSNNFASDDYLLMGNALLNSTTSKLAGLKCNAFELWVPFPVN